MGTYEQRYYKKINSVAFWFLLAHLPVFIAISYLFKSQIESTVIIGSLILLGPIACRYLSKNLVLISLTNSVAAVSLSALLIHISGGMIEMHFHIFVMLALMIVYGNIGILIVSAGLVAVHHIAFYFLLPSSVFNYEASFWIVLIHAAFVILQVVPSCFIAHKYRNFIRAQDMLLTDVAAFSGNISQEINPLRGASRMIQDGSQRQVSEIEKSNETLVSIGAKSQENVTRATAAKESTRKARAETEQAVSRLAQMDAIMDSINQSNQKVEMVIKTIEEIAFQTNLLALNAAVEAARAGEAGKGFAVVAEEVRNLSSRSSDAVKETSQQIEGMITNNTSGLSLIEEVRDSLSHIAECVRNADALVDDITISSKNQNTDLQTVEQSMRGVNDISQEQASNVTQSAGSVENIGVEFERLQMTLERVMKILG